MGFRSYSIRIRSDEGTDNNRSGIRAASLAKLVASGKGAARVDTWRDDHARSIVLRSDADPSTGQGVTSENLARLDIFDLSGRFTVRAVDGTELRFAPLSGPCGIA